MTHKQSVLALRKSFWDKMPGQNNRFKLFKNRFVTLPETNRSCDSFAFSAILQLLHQHPDRIQFLGQFHHHYEHCI